MMFNDDDDTKLPRKHRKSDVRVTRDIDWLFLSSCFGEDILDRKWKYDCEWKGMIKLSDMIGSEDLVTTINSKTSLFIFTCLVFF